MAQAPAPQPSAMDPNPDLIRLERFVLTTKMGTRRHFQTVAPLLDTGLSGIGATGSTTPRPAPCVHAYSGTTSWVTGFSGEPFGPIPNCPRFVWHCMAFADETGPPRVAICIPGETPTNVSAYCLDRYDRVSLHYCEIAAGLLHIYGAERFESIAIPFFKHYKAADATLEWSPAGDPAQAALAALSSRPLQSLLRNAKPDFSVLAKIGSIGDLVRGRTADTAADLLAAAGPERKHVAEMSLDFALAHKRWPINVFEAKSGRPFPVVFPTLGISVPYNTKAVALDENWSAKVDGAFLVLEPGQNSDDVDRRTLGIYLENGGDHLIAHTYTNMPGRTLVEKLEYLSQPEARRRLLTTLNELVPDIFPGHERELLSLMDQTPDITKFPEIELSYNASTQVLELKLRERSKHMIRRRLGIPVGVPGRRLLAYLFAKGGIPPLAEATAFMTKFYEGPKSPETTTNREKGRDR